MVSVPGGRAAIVVSVLIRESLFIIRLLQIHQATHFGRCVDKFALSNVLRHRDKTVFYARFKARGCEEQKLRPNYNSIVS